jgi:hypothetical protein
VPSPSKHDRTGLADIIPAKNAPIDDLPAGYRAVSSHIFFQSDFFAAFIDQLATAHRQCCQQIAVERARHALQASGQEQIVGTVELDVLALRMAQAGIEICRHADVDRISIETNIRRAGGFLFDPFRRAVGRAIVDNDQLKVFT